MVDSYLAYRQRQRAPYDPYHGRRGTSQGGVDTVHPITAAPGLETESERYNGASNDSGVVRDRIPFYEKDRYQPPAQGWVDWTLAGPRRPELHMRNMSYAREQGSSNSRFPTADTPTGGLHTMTPTTTARTTPRYVQTSQMRAAPYDRLSPGQYSGQTYSQTTVTRRMGR